MRPIIHEVKESQILLALLAFLNHNNYINKAIKGKKMKHVEIMATERKIAYVDNTAVISSDPMFHKLVMVAVHADTTELPEELADLVVLSYVRIDATENRAVLNWA